MASILLCSYVKHSLRMMMHQNNKEDHLNSVHTLQILDEIAKGDSVTQRALSKKLGIGLGMVNSYLNRLAREGYIQITQAERKRLHYLLTPMGIAEKSVLAYRYLKKSYQVFTEARERVGDFLRAMEMEGVESIVFYKTTVVTEIALMALQNSSLDLVAIVDDVGTGRKFLGYRVLPVDVLRQIAFDRLIITADESVESAAEHLRQYGVEANRICFLQ
ncbi:MAG: winged helix-turn-helix transcriptional regulator [Nitrospirae bacterium]|nr:winged helix-turn-helix transcriptional regulator [Nitrospirota bacterium]